MKPELVKDRAQLTKSEEKICDYIEEYMNKSIFMTVSEIASNCGVGEASVTRFCKKLGFHSFLEFKMTMAQEYHNSTMDDEMLSDGEAIEADSLPGTMKQYFEHVNTLLRSSMKKNTFEQIEQGTKMLLDCRQICIWGSGRDEGTACDAYYKLLDYGKACDFPRSYQELELKLKAYGTEDLILVIDSDGDDEILHTLLEESAKKGVKLLAVTGNRMSRLAILSEETISYAVGSVHQSEFSYSSTMAQHYMLDLLIQNMMRHEYGDENTKIDLS